MKLIKNYKYGTKVPILEFQNQQDNDLKYLAEFIYNNVFLNYTTKQWGLSPENIEDLVTARVLVYLSKDNQYFQDCYQGIPQNGYTEMIQNLLTLKDIEIICINDGSKDSSKKNS